MLAFKSSVEKLERDVARLEAERDSLRQELFYMTVKWNDLVKQINAKGGENFLRNAKIFPPPGRISQFTDAELRKLLMLCHPDKHDGKELAVEMTKKLNNLRK